MKITYLSKNEYIAHDIYVQNLPDCRFCVFDFEGTGINFRTEYFTQIGAVIVEKNNILTSNTFNSLVNSPKQMPPAVEELTGISNQDLIGAPSFTEVYEQFVKYIGESVLVTQAGYEYVVPLLEKHCSLYKLPMVDNPIVDTKLLFTNIHPEISEVISTDFLIKYYKICTDDLKRHDALDDCILIGRIFIEIIKEYKERLIKNLNVKSLKVKRFIIPGMYLEEGNNFC